MQAVFITMLLLITLLPVHSQDKAEVMKKNDKTYIQYGEDLVEPTDVISVNERVDIYVVRSGDVGTSVIITVFRGIIWDKEKKEVLGMFPYKYKALNDPGYKIDQPEWDIQKEIIKIKDLNMNLETTVNL